MEERKQINGQHVYVSGTWYEISNPNQGGVVESGDCIPIMTPREVYDRVYGRPSGNKCLHVKADQRHLRDYDNVEHRCITNMLAAHMLWGDSPKCMISMDVLAPGETNFTEVRIMPVTAFREFVMSEKLTFNL